MEKNITIFKSWSDTKRPYFISMHTVIERIKDGNSKNLVNEIRLTDSDEHRRKLKDQLPAIVFSGRFERRAISGQLNHSGYIVLDFDKLGNRKAEVRELLLLDKYTHLLFESPSGNGYKAVIRIPDRIETHRQSARAIKKYFSTEASYDHFEDECRICYESYDPDLYYNPNSEVFTKMEKEEVFEYTSTKEIIQDEREVYTRLKVWLEKKGEYYEDGNKHIFLVKLAGACNRFGINQYSAVDMMKGDYLNAASTVNPQDFDKIIDRVYKSYKHQNGIAEFEKEGIPRERGTHNEIGEDVFDTSLKVNDFVYLNDIQQRMITGFEKGYDRGTTTYFSEIDRHWKWKKGELNLMHGMGNHGKSALMLQLCLIKSVREGDKWAVFSPEQNPADDFYNDLIHAYVGESTTKGAPNQMIKQKYIDAMDFIKDHFFYLYPQDDSPTPELINNRFEQAIRKHEITGCIIDPFNQLDNDWKRNGRDDLYISEFLSTQKRFALRHEQYMIIIAHPKGGIPKNKQGNYECPDVYDLAGGAMWNNKIDNILVTYRPNYSTDPFDTSVEFRSQKIKKQKLVGIPGTVELSFERSTARYYQNNTNPLEVGGIKIDTESLERKWSSWSN